MPNQPTKVQPRKSPKDSMNGMNENEKLEQNSMGSVRLGVAGVVTRIFLLSTEVNCSVDPRPTDEQDQTIGKKETKSRKKHKK